MESKNSVPLSSLTNSLREKNARRYSQHLTLLRKRKQCKGLKDDINTQRRKLEELKDKLKETRKLDRIRKKASTSWLTLTEHLHNDKSLVKSSIFMQRIAMEKKKHKNEKLIRFVDGRMEKFLEFYNRRPAISKINNLQMTYELLLKETESKKTFLVKAKAVVKEQDDNFVKICVSMSEAVVKNQKSLEAAENQRQVKKRIVELERKILELRIREEPVKKPYQLNFYADVEWADYDDLQSVQPMSVASPETQVNSSYEQGPMSCLSLDVSAPEVSAEQSVTAAEFNYADLCEHEQTQNEHLPFNPSQMDVTSSENTAPANNLDPTTIIDETSTEIGNYYYTPIDYHPSGLYVKSPDPPQSVGSVDFNAQAYAKSPDPPQDISLDNVPPSPVAPDAGLPNFFPRKEDSNNVAPSPNFFSRKEDTSATNSSGMFFNFGSSSKEPTTSFFNLF